MKTVIPYMYRDASNYQQVETFVLDGAITNAQKKRLAAALDDSIGAGGGFIPEQIGVTHLGNNSDWKFPSEDDHCWHELDIDSIEVVPDDDEEGGRVRVDFPTVEAFIATMEEARKSGWDVGQYGILVSDEDDEWERTCDICERVVASSGDLIDGQCENCNQETIDRHAMPDDGVEPVPPNAPPPAGPQGRVAAGSPDGGQFTSQFRSAPKGL